MNKFTLLFLLIPVIYVITFADDRANLFVCDSMKYRICCKKPFDPNSQVVTSSDLVYDIKQFLIGRKNDIDDLANYYLVNGRIDFASNKARGNFYYGLVSLLIDPDIGLLNRDDLEDYILVWCSEKMLAQIDRLLLNTETKDEIKIIRKIQKKVHRMIKKRGH